MNQQQMPLPSVGQWPLEENRIGTTAVARVELAVLPADALASEVFDDDAVMQAGVVVVHMGNDYRLVQTRHLLEKAISDGDMAMAFPVADVVGLRMSQVSVQEAQTHGVDLLQPDAAAFSAWCEELETPLLIVTDLAGATAPFDPLVLPRPRVQGFVDVNNFHLAPRVFRCSINPSETFDEQQYRQLGGICQDHPGGKLS